MVQNTPNIEFRVQWGGSGVFVANKADATSLHELMNYLHQFGPLCIDFSAIMKRSETPQNICLWSNRVDRVRLLQKILTQLRCTNLCISCTSSAYFAMTFILYQNGLKHPKTRIIGQMGCIGCVHCEKVPRDFVARTCALIAPLRRVLHRLLCSNKMVQNATKHLFRVQWGGSGTCVAKNSDTT
jgi:hypothetical protein